MLLWHAFFMPMVRQTNRVQVTLGLLGSEVRSESLLLERAKRVGFHKWGAPSAFIMTCRCEGLRGPNMQSDPEPVHVLLLFCVVQGR